MMPMVVMAEYSDVEWLAQNIYHEARGEGIQGMIAISIVTINRVHDKNYPNTIKGVITQPHQFTWYNKKKIKTIKKNNNYNLCLIISNTTIKLWKSKRVMHLVKLFDIDDIKWYHNKKEKPRWLYGMNQTTQIGNHLFYKGI
jgi:N-acetylmuramoyl-L-alanine amidase